MGRGWHLAGRCGSIPPMRVLATASAGTARLLAEECGDIGLRPRKVRAHGVELDLDWPEIARALIYLRTAQRVLVFLQQFPCGGGNSLYEGAAQVCWADWLDPGQRIAVAASGRLPSKAVRGDSPIRTHVFACQRVKDALCDQLRDATGERPSVDLDDPDVRIVARFSGDACSLWLDPAGAALHRRGYRVESGPAPLRETLAAAIVRASGWHGEQPLRDLLCGSGTVLIEAASAALGLAPGRDRTFAAERWRHRGHELAGQIATERRAAVDAAHAAIAKPKLDVRGLDIDPRVLRLAEANVQRAGLGRHIQLRAGDARHTSAPEPGSVLISNLPYGERLGGDEVTVLYAELGRHWAGFTGCEAHLLVGHDDFAPTFGLRWTDRMAQTNGSLPVTLFLYELG